jgi:hypothetical protein
MRSTTASLERAYQERLRRSPLPEWVRRMIEHHRKTGTYRTEDLRRLLGDPVKGFDVEPRTNLTTLSQPQRKRP